MITNFNEKLFLESKDANVAIFVENLACWIKFNATKDKLEDRNFRDGRYWSFNSLPQLANYFGVYSIQNLRTIINKCVKLDLIKIGSFNKKKYDNTNWYTLTDKGLEYYPVLKGIFLNTPVSSNSTPVEINRPIPENTTHLRDLISDIVETYHEELPELPKIKKVDSKLKTQLQRMVKDWPTYQKEGKEFSKESFRDYLNYIKQHYSWFIKPYRTNEGNIRKNNLRILTRETNITKIVNGEFSAA